MLHARARQRDGSTRGGAGTTPALHPPPPRRSSSWLARVVVTFLVAATTSSAFAGTASAETRVDAPTVRLVAESPDTVFTIPGHGRYSDTIELLPAPDGRLVVVNEQSMDTYVEGLAEMPISWPLEALKAQAVTARTYAWYSIALGTFEERGLPFDICATVDCQVFAGRKYVEARGGDRWRRAVADTSGETLTWQGRPILARFFSSSGGHTRDNEDVYGTRAPEGPRPYLKGVPDADEAISPHHRWRWELRRADLDRLLSHGRSLSAAVPVRSIERVVSDGTRVDQIRVIGRDGTTVEVSASAFRAWVSEVAPRVLPERWPIRDASGRPMPDGMPSSRIDFCLTCREDVVVVDGRGWGHGVGLSQWGARGKAERGVAYEDIVATYYQGLRPEVSPHLPERVRVGLTWESSGVTVEPTGPYRLIVGDRSARRSAEGEVWRAEPAGDVVTISGPSTGWEPYEEPPPQPAPPQVPADAPGEEVSQAPRGVSLLPSARAADGAVIEDGAALAAVAERFQRLTPLIGPTALWSLLWEDET